MPSFRKQITEIKGEGMIAGDHTPLHRVFQVLHVAYATKELLTSLAKSHSVNPIF